MRSYKLVRARVGSSRFVWAHKGWDVLVGLVLSRVLVVARVGSYCFMCGRAGSCVLTRAWLCSCFYAFYRLRVATRSCGFSWLVFFTFLKLLYAFSCLFWLVSSCFCPFLAAFFFLSLFLGSCLYAFYAFLAFLCVFTLILHNWRAPTHWMTNLPAEPRVESLSINEPTHIYTHTCIYNLYI